MSLCDCLELECTTCNPPRGELYQDLERAVATMSTAPLQPSPPLCRACPCVLGRHCPMDDVAHDPWRC